MAVCIGQLWIFSQISRPNVLFSCYQKFFLVFQTISKKAWNRFKKGLISAMPRLVLIPIPKKSSFLNSYSTWKRLWSHFHCCLLKSCFQLIATFGKELGYLLQILMKRQFVTKMRSIITANRVIDKLWGFVTRPCFNWNFCIKWFLCF